MKERTIIPGILFGIVLGVATLYGGVLLSTWLPIPFVFYGLPLPSLVVLGVLAISVYMLKRIGLATDHGVLLPSHSPRLSLYQRSYG